MRGLRNLGPKALATIHQTVTAFYAGSLTASTPLPGPGPAPTAQVAAFTTGQLLTLLGACVHELRHRGVTPTIDDILGHTAGDINTT